MFLLKFAIFEERLKTGENFGLEKFSSCFEIKYI